MSVRQIQEELNKLTPEELAEVAGFLRALRVKSSPEFRERIAEANRRMDAGQKVTQEEVEREFQRLRSKAS